MIRITLLNLTGSKSRSALDKVIAFLVPRFCGIVEGFRVGLSVTPYSERFFDSVSASPRRSAAHNETAVSVWGRDFSRPFMSEELCISKSRLKARPCKDLVILAPGFSLGVGDALNTNLSPIPGNDSECHEGWARIPVNKK